MFKNRTRTIIALAVSPWLAAVAMTIIDMLFILAGGGDYTTADMGEAGVFSMNLLLYSIVFAPVSYAATLLLFLPAIYLLHCKNTLTFIWALITGAGIGFIVPSLIKVAFYLFSGNSEPEWSLSYILPNFSTLENAEPYIMSTLSAVVVVLGIWFIGGLTSHPNVCVNTR